MPFTGIWVGEGGGTFSGESSTEAQLMTYVAQTATTTGNILSSVNTLETWLNAWKSASDSAQSNLQLHLSEHEAHLQRVDDWLHDELRDLNAKLDRYEANAVSRSQSLSQQVTNATSQIVGLLQTAQADLTAFRQSVTSFLNDISTDVERVYNGLQTVQDDLVQHDRNMVGRTQEIYTRCGNIMTGVEEIRVKIRQFPQLLCVFKDHLLSPFYDKCQPDDNARVRLEIDPNPYATEQGTGYSYRIVLQEGKADGLQTTVTNGVVDSSSYKLVNYGEFRPAYGSGRFYFSSELPTILTYPYRIAGDGGQNLQD